MNGEYLLIRTMSRLHGWLYRLSRGSLGASFGGPVLLLSTTGRKTGRKRNTPLYYIEHASGWAVVGSNAGLPRPPGWWANLKAHPSATLRIGRKVARVRAREATGEEWAMLWPRFIELYAGYERYRRQARRDLPIVMLEKV